MQDSNAVYHFSKSSALWLRRNRILEDFTTYGPGGHVTSNVRTNVRSSDPCRLHKSMLCDLKIQLCFLFLDPYDPQEIWLQLVQSHGKVKRKAIIRD